MKINLHIILDVLSNYHPIMNIDSSIDLNIEKIRILQSHNVLEVDCLYITDLATFLHRRYELTDYCLICLGNPTSLFDDNLPLNSIFISTPIDLIEFYHYLLDQFFAYSNWNLQLMDSIVNKKGLQELLDIGVTVLDNPIGLFDATFVFMMMSGQLPEDYHGTIWEDVLTTGYAPFDKIPFNEQKRAHNTLESMPEYPFFFKHQEADKNTQIMANLFINNKRFGILGLIDICKPFTLGQLSLVYHLKNVMEYALQHSNDYMGNPEASTYWIDRLIQGFAIEDKIIHYHLSKMNWTLNANYSILNFSAPKDTIEIDQLKIYMHQIKKMISDSIIFTFENSIVLIVREKNYAIKDNDLFIHLDRRVDRFGLKYGISMTFSDFTQIKYFYIQSKIALSEGLQKDQSEIHYFFKDYYADHIVHSLSCSTSLKSICHPKIINLQQYDKKNKTALTNSLLTYLKNGKNIQRTADKLFIHRNSLCYRLNKIEQLLDIDLDDEQQLFHIYFSCILIDYL